MKNQNGITLAALILTVVVLIVIAGISISTGTEALDSTRLKGFYAQLEFIQKRVDDIASTNESYIDGNGNSIYLKDYPDSQLTVEEQTKLSNILSGSSINLTNFKYFTKEELENILGLPDMEYNVFIDFENRIVIAEEGIDINGQKYYMLESAMYFVETNTNKNVGTIETLQYNIQQYGSDKYKITVIPSNIIGDLNETGYIKYKKTTTKYWETSNSLEIIVEFDIEYNIIYVDSNKNSIEKVIKAEFEKDDEGNFTKDEEGNNILIVTEVTTEESEEI